MIAPLFCPQSLDNLQKIYQEYKFEYDGISYVFNRIGNIVTVSFNQSSIRQIVANVVVAGTIPTYMAPRNTVLFTGDAETYSSFVEVNISSNNVSYKRRNEGMFSFGNISYFAKDVY